MIGFLSKEADSSAKVTKENISFVHIPDGISIDEIKISISSKAKLFADYLNLNEVFLHFGKGIIKYDFKE